MKNIINQISLIFCIILFPIFSSYSANKIPETNNISIGYSYNTFFLDKSKNINKNSNLVLQGINLKYCYEWYSPISFMNSLSYAQSYTLNKLINESTKEIYLMKVKTNKFTLAVGPKYRFDKNISIYGLVGSNINTTETSINSIIFKEKDINNNFIYSIGMQINITKKIFIDLNYESIFNELKILNNTNSKINFNTFILGMGYIF